MKKPKMTKVRHDRDLRIEHNGNVWTVDAAEWRADDGTGELRIYEIHGSITDPALKEALELEAASRGIPLNRLTDDMADAGRSR